MPTTIKLEKDRNAGKKLESSCGTCKRVTKHLILAEIHLHGTDEDVPIYSYQWIDEYQIIQCQGCETVTFRKTHENEVELRESPFDDKVAEHILYIDQYPNPEEGRGPIQECKLLPSDLNRIYTETLHALNSNQPVLTGIGIRAIVETVCKDKNSIGKDLYSKINNLVELGVLTKEGADILHKLRTLGNASAHEVKPHDTVQLGLAIDVIDHLLQGVYILPIHAKNTFK